jgi:hypothetical protein
VFYTVGTGGLAPFRFIFLSFNPLAPYENYTIFSFPLSPNAPASSTQANWADRENPSSAAIAHFSELVAVQRFRYRVCEIPKSRGARKMGQNFDI